jgi:monoamine oxidase
MRNVETDVLILGAGAAGLVAARDLAAAGLRVVILEARDRIGGRIHTLRDPACAAPVERGAEFIHGRPPETFEILAAAGLQSTPVAGQNWEFRDGEFVRQAGAWDHVQEIFHRLETFNGPDMSFRQFLELSCSDLPPEARAEAVGYVEGFHAADYNRFGVYGLLEAERALETLDGDASFRPVGGYDQIPRWLCDAAERLGAVVALETVVSTIRWRPGAVEVEARTGRPPETVRYSAAKLVVTLPLGVWKAPPGSLGSVHFEPDLPQKREAVERLEMGPVMRLVCCFDEPFWRLGEATDVGFLHAPWQPFPTLWAPHPGPRPMVVAWAGGREAAHLAQLSDEEVRELMRDELARLFELSDDWIATHLRSLHVCNWQTDPFSRGAYSYVAVGGKDAPRQLAEPVAGTLFFAGEATHPGLSGTVSGALASGLRAAREVLDGMRR